MNILEKLKNIGAGLLYGILCLVFIPIVVGKYLWDVFSDLWEKIK